MTGDRFTVNRQVRPPDAPAELDDRLTISISGETAAESTLLARFEARRDEDRLATAAVTYVAVDEAWS